MTYLPSLIKKIDSFYSLIKKAQTTWNMPDDPEEDQLEQDVAAEDPLYEKIINTLANFNNQDIADEVLVIAEEYRAAIKIGGGFNEVLKHIGVARAGVADQSNGENDEQEEEIAEDFLNEMELVIRKLAKAPAKVDNQVALQELKKVRENVKQMQAAEEMSGQKSVFEKGKPGQELGHSTGPKPSIAITPEKYENEIRVLAELRDDPANEDQRNSITKLMNLNKVILSQMKEVRSLKDRLTIIPEDKETLETLTNVEEELFNSRKERTRLKIELRTLQQTKELENIKEKANSASDTKEKEWLNLFVRLQNVRLLPYKFYRGKIPVVNALQKIIESAGAITPSGDFVSLQLNPNEKIKLLSDLHTAEEAMETLAVYDRKRTEERTAEQGREIPNYPAERGGYRPQKGNNFSGFSYKALCKEFRDRKNTAIDSTRRYITNEKEDGIPALKPYVNDVSVAIRKKDNAAKFKAINELKIKIREDFASKEPQFQSYRRAIKLLPIFKNIEDRLSEMIAWQKDDEWDISDLKRRNTIEYFVHDLNQLISQYSKYYQTQKGLPAEFSKILKDILPRFDAVIKYIPNIIKYFENDVLKEDQIIARSIRTSIEKFAQYFDLQGNEISKSKYNRIQTEQKVHEQGREEIPHYPAERGGYRPQKKVDFSKVSLLALAEELRYKNNTAINTARQYIYSEKSEGKAQLKPYIDAVSFAIRKKDNALKHSALSDLKVQINNLNMNKSFQDYRRSLKLLPIFKGIEKRLFDIVGWKHSELEKDNAISNLLWEMKEITGQYMQRYQSKNNIITPRFDAVIKIFPKIEKYLTDLNEEK